MFANFETVILIKVKQRAARNENKTPTNFVLESSGLNVLLLPSSELLSKHIAMTAAKQITIAISSPLQIWLLRKT